MSLVNIDQFFLNTRLAANQIGAELNHFKAITPGSLHLPTAERFVQVKLLSAKASSAAKIALFALKIFVSFVAEGLSFSVRYPLVKHKIRCQIKQDIALLSPVQQLKIRRQIQDWMQQEKLPTYLQTKEYTDAALAAYATSQTHYAPIVVEWAHSVLDTAKQQNRKVVFLARDGRAPYQVATQLKARYSEKYGKVGIDYGYLSRRVVGSSKANTEDPTILLDYIKTLGVNKGDKCLFVDIGFQGSMISSIRKQLAPLSNDIEFQYLVSLTPNAHGFLGDMTTPLESVPQAGQNSAVHWLEDSHQGVINSPKRLMRLEDGRIVPDVLAGDVPSTCKSRSARDYLLKHWSARAIEDYLPSQSKEDLDRIVNREVEEWRMSDKATARLFDAYLQGLRNGYRYNLVKHV